MFCIIEKSAKDIWKRKVIILIFSSALIVSHYAMAFIYLYFIIFLYFLFRIQSKIIPVLSPGMILFMIVFTFTWYMFISNSPLNTLLSNFIRITRLFWTDFLSIDSRSQASLTPLSITMSTNIVGMIHKLLIYIEHIFLCIGMIVLITRPKKFRLYPIFRFISLISLSLLLLCFIVPNLSHTLNLTRFYSILIPLFCPLFILGGTFLLGLKKVYYKNFGLNIVVCIIIITFLFNIGLVTHVTKGYPYSFSLDLDRRLRSSDLGIKRHTHSEYYLNQEIFSATWLLNKMDSNFKVYAGLDSQKVLRSYALLPGDRMLQILNNTSFEPRSYIFFKYLNVKVGIIKTTRGFIETSDLSHKYKNYSKIYSNSCSDIYLTA